MVLRFGGALGGAGCDFVKHVGQRLESSRLRRCSRLVKRRVLDLAA